MCVVRHVVERSTVHLLKLIHSKGSMRVGGEQWTSLIVSGLMGPGVESDGPRILGCQGVSKRSGHGEMEES